MELDGLRALIERDFTDAALAAKPFLCLECETQRSYVA
jgi:hypothetical protein